VAEVIGNTAPSIEVPFGGAYTTRLVRLVGRHGPLHQAHYARVNELEVYGT
jgi:hypothetical protein